jgi:hypothetical protein
MCAGAHLVIANLTIDVESGFSPAAADLASGAGGWEALAALSASAISDGARLELRNVLIRLPDCQQLAALQQNVCSLAVASSIMHDQLWAAPLVCACF